MARTKRKLKDLTKEEFNILKCMGFLWELYPEAPEFYEEIRSSVRCNCRYCGKKRPKKAFDEQYCSGSCWAANNIS
jgi:hypothetical protein